jgi:hypothetical protein
MKIDHQSLMQAATPVPVDFPAMVASTLASQIGSPAAIAQIHHDVACSVADSREDAMATLMQVQPGWRAAAGVLGGSFHPRVAAQLGAKGL